MYIDHDDSIFPIGFIGGGPISVDQARTTVERTFGSRYNPILHLALAPHDGSLGFKHDHVVQLDELPRRHTTFVGDAMIVRKGNKPFAIDTFVGDCAVIIAASGGWLGFIHCGTPELFANPSILEAFRAEWPDPTSGTYVFMGPSISGKWYAYQPERVPEQFKSFTLEPGEDGNAFDDQSTFAVNLAIERELQRWQPASLDNCGIDPFDANINGNHNWASARYAQFQQQHGVGNGLSPRDCAMFTYQPNPALFG